MHFWPGEHEPFTDGGLQAVCVVPAHVKLRYLLSNALSYRSAAGRDQPPRHQIKWTTSTRDKETKIRLSDKAERLIYQFALVIKMDKCLKCA